MIFHEILKYRPQNYDCEGKYIVDEWTSMSDIGKSFNGKKFTLKEYLHIEQQHVNVINAIMSSTKCKYLTIKYIEADKKVIMERMKSSRFCVEDSLLQSSIVFLKKGKNICSKNLDNIIRLALREYIYVILYNKKYNLQVEFGYDYYLYISCPLNNTTLEKIVQDNGLYLDPRSK